MILNFDYLTVLTEVLAFEIPVFWLAAQSIPELKTHFCNDGLVRTAGLIALVNFCVHPVVFFGFMGSNKTYLSSVILGQIFSIAAKSLLLSWAASLGFRPTLYAVALATLASWQFAPLLNFLLFY